MSDRIRPTWAEIDLDAIAHNAAQLKRRASGAELMAVVKANGYGHGAEKVAAAALAAGASWLGVAVLEEGLQLRKAGITAPILVLGYIPAAQADMVVLYDLRPTVYDLSSAQACAQWARALRKQVPVHVKVDTGMGRIGVTPGEAVSFVEALASTPGIQVEGIYTHLAVADDPDDPYTAQQNEVFGGVLSALEGKGLLPPLRHAANSAGILFHPNVHYDMVRAGIALYGLPPAPGTGLPADLRPALSWKTRISHVKRVAPGTSVSYGRTYRAQGDEVIATLPVGYADGLRRGLSNRGEVLVGGVRAPIVGRICMDQAMVRLPPGHAAAVGDEVVLIGRQGNEEITATEMASLLDTINYEVLTGITDRVPRLYMRGGNPVESTF